MHQESKWDGLLNIEEPNEPAPHRPRGYAAICALIAAMSLLAGVMWWIWSMPAPTRPPVATPTDHATNLNPTPATPTPAPTRVTSATPTPTHSQTVDVFAPARDTARTWIERFYIERTEATTWTQIAQRLTPLQTWAMGAYMAEHPETQAAPLNIHHVQVAYSDETADAEHPTTWSATATITLDTGQQVSARITVIPDPDTVDGGWKVDQWKVLP